MTLVYMDDIYLRCVPSYAMTTNFADINIM